MERISNIIDQVKLPKAIFKLYTSKSHDCVFLEPSTAVGDLAIPNEENSSLVQLINTYVPKHLILQKQPHQLRYKYTINKDSVIEHVLSEVIKFHCAVWMHVNKKSDFRRTKLNKDLRYARSSGFKENILELFLDAEKYGITIDTINSKPKITSLHKFIAAKFQAMVEAECPR